MSYFYSILYIAILSTSVFAMDGKETTDRSSKDNQAYNPTAEIHTPVITPNKSVVDVPSTSKADQKNK